MFVVQKHAATRLHYDFRLEMEGVLKSWAVPKGFPTQRGDRRLAIEVEDHPIEYGDFEGTIPPGNYGAGTVMLWDTGFYEVIGERPEKALREGKLHLLLDGKKLKGEWTLVRIQRQDSSKLQWLLMKTGTDTAPFSERAENRSALSSRTFEQIAKANDREWRSDRSARSRSSALPLPNNGRTRKSNDSLAEKVSTKANSKINFVEPMKARLVSRLPTGKNWLYELKFDGVRALAIKEGEAVRLVSRAGKELTAKYALLAEQVKSLPVQSMILDGEVVALDPQGRPDFQLLQCYHVSGLKKPPLFYYAFDLIQLDGKDVRSLPLVKRKEMAKELIEGVSENLRFSGELRGPPSRLVEQLRKRGLEGLVAKMRNSNYEAGKRSGAWLKYKWSNEQEFVMGGYTPPKGSRNYFGAVLVGYYQGKELIFAGKVGTGFDQKLLGFIFEKFQKLKVPDCPFADLMQGKSSQAGGLSGAELRRCTWVKPRLVCQVRFAEWTRDGHLRQPAFLGLVEDKAPEEVIRETPAENR
jgi:bifunctional non-homologous end joining protein LigD